MPTPSDPTYEPIKEVDGTKLLEQQIAEADRQRNDCVEYQKEMLNTFTPLSGSRCYNPVDPESNKERL